MSDIDLSRLSPQSFERLVRALAFRLLGPGGTVFGPGPDGGRDFIYEGKIQGYQERGWDGYLVLQAKFRQRPQEAPEDSGQPDDVSWLQGAIQYEELKYQDDIAAHRKPKYYIVATNIVLSGADGRGPKGSRRTGGHAKVASTLTGWKKSIGLKDFDIWPASKISDLLDDAADIRQTYAAWITSGDVLAAALSQMKISNPKFPDIIRRAMKKAVRRDQFARLQDAGSTTTNHVRIGQVFVDLPATGHLDSAEPAGAARWRDGILSQIVEKSKDRFDFGHQNIQINNADRSQQTQFNTALENKIVVLGGPGQGKSTASTFAAQLFRSVLLKDSPNSAYDTVSHPIITETLARASTQSISVDIPRRYPVFVNLPRYADDISEAKRTGAEIPSLMTRISNDIGRDADTIVGREHLREWMRINPWILILDGLDEVPQSGERPAIIQAIEDMEVEVAELRADVLFLVTTRPQGYNKDLDPSRWQHWTLDDLNSQQALTYAKALTNASYPDDPERREDILRALQEATDRAATTRLMKSPLQVTIMQLIVDTGGSVPRARWTLFQQYFEVLTKREKAKGGPTRQAIERHEGQLGPIHHQVGLVLHTDSENKGGASASLSRGRFIQLIKSYLLEEGYEEAESNLRAEQLASLAVNRLVLLTPQDRDNIGFEVRSLQEFMAAAAITTGDPTKVQERLAHISGVAHWRNAFLIAASRCFSENMLHYQRTAVCALPRQLDFGSQDDSLVKSGARLALEMFEDGLGADHPVSRRSLCQHALELLDLGPENYDIRLRLLVEPGTVGVVENGLRERMRNGSNPSALSAWRLGLETYKRDAAALELLVEANVPDDASALLELLNINSHRYISPRIADIIKSRFLAASPSDLKLESHPFWRKFESDRLLKDFPHLSQLATIHLSEETILERAKIAFHLAGLEGGVSARIVPAKVNYPHELDDLSNTSAGWKVISMSSAFSRQPSAAILSTTLSQIACNPDLFNAAKRVLYFLPWPLAALVRLAEDAEHLQLLSLSCNAGVFGNVNDWEDAEKRWAANGVSVEDVIRVAIDGMYFGSDVAVRGLPWMAGTTISRRKPGTRSEILALSEQLQHLPDGHVKQDLTGTLTFSLLGLVDDNIISDERHAHTIMNVVDNARDGTLFTEMFEILSPELWDNDEIVKRLSANAHKFIGYGSISSDIDIEVLIRAYSRRPNEHRGLLLGIATWACTEKDRSRYSQLDSIPLDELQPHSQDAPVIASAAAILSICRDESCIEHVVSVLADEGGERMGIRLARNLLSRDILPAHLKQSISSGLIMTLRNHQVDTSHFNAVLKSTLDRRRSELASAEVWCRLGLPSSSFPILLGGE